MKQFQINKTILKYYQKEKTLQTETDQIVTEKIQKKG